jgi:hypothetical protein
MKAFRLLPVYFLALFTGISAISVSAQSPLKKTKASMALALTLPEGTNGSAVAWDPEQKRYYTLVAGNADFPIECFDESGKSLGGASAGADLRGLWFYPEKGEIEANGYGEGGYYVIVQDASGIPTGDVETISEGMNQPEEQSVGTYDPMKKCVVFISGSSLVLYERASSQEHQTIGLTLSKKIYAEDLNYTSVGFTGKSGYEYAALDFTHKKVLLFNRKGTQTGAVSLPKDATVGEAFWFAVANGKAWIYNVESRIWTGYNLFK